MKALPYLLLLSASACTPELQPASRPSTKLPPALVRHREWSGGAQEWERLSALHFAGTLETAGLRGPVNVAMAREGRLRQDYDLGGLRGAEGIDAEGAWRLDPSGQIEGVAADAARRLRSDLELAFGGLFTGAFPVTAAAEPVIREGVRHDVVTVDLGSGRMLDLLIAADGEVRYRREHGPAGEIWTELSDYTVVAGVRIPRREVVTGKDSRIVTWKQITANAEVPARLLERPAAAAGPGTLPGGVAMVRVAFELHHNRYVYGKGKLGAVATDIVVDSGAGITVVDAALAAQVGLRGESSIRAKGVGGNSREVQLARGVRLELGGIVLDGLTVAILDLTEVHEKIGRPMPVILGKELFHTFTIELDYGKRELRVHDPARYVAAEGAVILPTRPLDDGHVMVELGFEDLPPAWFMVDTGSGDTLALHQPYVVENALLSRYSRLGERRVGGVGGSLPAKAATASLVRFAGHEFKDVPVVLATEAKGAFADPKSAGTLGAGLLGRFCVTFDYPRQRLLLTPGEHFAEPFVKDRLGMAVKTEAGRLVVDWVAPNGSADRAGVRVGEVVTAIDGERGDSKALRATLWEHSSDAKRIELVLALGERSVTVALNEYY